VNGRAPAEVQFWSPLASMPLDLPRLRAEAKADGYGFIERLHQDWQQGRQRFDAPGEILIVASVGGDEAAVGGLTIDPAVADALRVRRFYVRPAWRGSGLGRQLAEKLIEHATGFTPLLTVNAGTEAAGSFWLRMGFVASRTPGITHQRQLR
jgi:GNAT superfamily N-acetyltransferase